MPYKLVEPQMDQQGQKTQTDRIAQKNRIEQHGQKKNEYNEQEWEERLFEINGSQNKLKHKSIKPEDNTVEFEFVNKEMGLHEGRLMLQLEENSGQVFVLRQGAEQTNKEDLIFSGFGGSIKFNDTGIPQLAEQKLAVTNIMIPTTETGQTAKAKIRANLMDTVTIEPMLGMRVELKNGKYSNAAGEEKGALHFDTAVWFDGKQLADHIKLKYDDAGLQAEEGEKALLDVNQYDYAKKQQEALQEVFQGNEKLAGPQLQLKLILDKENGIRLGVKDMMFQKAAMTIGKTEFLLKHAEGMPGKFHTAEEADAELQGNKLYLQNISIQENQLKGKHGTLTFHDNKQENLTLQDVEMKEEEILRADSGQGTLDYKKIKLTGIELKQNQILQADSAEMEIEGFTTHLQTYSYQPGKINAYKSAQVETKVYAGLDRENQDNTNQEDKPEFLFAFALAEGKLQNGKFEEETKGEDTLSHFNLTQIISEKEKKEGVQLKRKIFTRDGFAELETETMQFQKQGGENAKVIGKGNFKLGEIPYKLTKKNGKVVEGIANSPEEDLKGIEYSIDSEGNLFADFENEEAKLSLKKKLFRKFENVSESNIKQVRLSGLKIENGYLKVSSIYTYLGGGVEQELEKNANDSNEIKNLKNALGKCNLSATIANKTENVKLTPKGIEIKQEDNYTLGTISVEGLFGFLNGEIDYPAGTIGVSAEKGVETPEKPAFLKIGDKGNLGEGISLPIPIPAVPGLSGKFGLKPYASVGGKVYVEVSRGKSFGEPWLDKPETFEVKGGLGAEAKAGVTAFVGVEAGVNQIASVDLKLNANLGAVLKGALELSTKLQKDPGKSMHMADNLNFDGNIEGNVTGSLSIDSEAKLLFWKKQLFEYKLLEKELGALNFKISAYKDKDCEGLFEGWNFKDMKLTLKAPNGQQKELEMMNGISLSKVVDELKIEKLNELLKNENESVKTAWIALGKLKENQKNMLYVIDVKEKEELEKQIKALTEEVTVKIQKCMELLEKQEKILTETKNKEKQKLQTAENEWKDAKVRDKEAFYMMQAAQKGGFKKENVVGHEDWKNERFKSAMAQMGIAMLLGEYESGETQFRSSAVQEQNALTETEVPLDIGLNTFMESKVLDQGLTADGYVFTRSMSVMSDRSYADLLNQYPNLTFRELLQYAVAGKYKDKEINDEVMLPTDGEILRDLLKACLKATIEYRKIPENIIRTKKEHRKQYEQTKEKIETRFETVFEKTYKDLCTSGLFQKPEDIWTKMEEIVSNKEKAAKHQQEAEIALANTQKRLAEVGGKKTEYSEKLQSLKDNALGALTNKKFDSGKASTAVTILTEDYDKKMKDGQEILQGLSQNDPHKKMLKAVLQAKDIPTMLPDAAKIRKDG